MVVVQIHTLVRNGGRVDVRRNRDFKADRESAGGALHRGQHDRGAAQGAGVLGHQRSHEQLRDSGPEAPGDRVEALLGWGAQPAPVPQGRLLQRPHLAAQILRLHEVHAHVRHRRQESPGFPSPGPAFGRTAAPSLISRGAGHLRKYMQLTD